MSNRPKTLNECYGFSTTDSTTANILSEAYQQPLWSSSYASGYIPEETVLVEIIKRCKKGRKIFAGDRETRRYIVERYGAHVWDIVANLCLWADDGTLEKCLGIIGVQVQTEKEPELKKEKMTLKNFNVKEVTFDSLLDFKLRRTNGSDK